jgi:hypothetical protein
MYTVRERIEEIERSAVRQAEGLLLDAVRESWSNADIAAAARYWDQAKERLEDAQLWREKVKARDAFFDLRQHPESDDPFRIEDTGPFTTYDAWAASEDARAAEARKKG